MSSLSLKIFNIVLVLCVISFLTGCETLPGGSDSRRGKSKFYSYPEEEARWIKDGNPIEYEGQKWYPSDNMENLLDSEVELLGVYNGVEFFVEQLDVKPYNQLYTKFGRHKFRVFIPQRS